MALENIYTNLYQMNPQQAGEAYIKYLAQMKKIGAAEIMNPRQFATTGAYRFYLPKTLNRRKKEYNTMRTTGVEAELGQAGITQGEIQRLRRR